jgi:signal transduction histidine kinase
MSDVPPVTGYLLGSTVNDIVGSAWLLGHDLKSPVSLIISAMEVIIDLYEKEGEDSLTTAIPMLRGALAAANRQHNMVSDMLDLARLETKTFELELARADIVEILREALKLEDYQITTKRLKLVLDLPDTPLWAKVNAEIIRRVFQAIIDNTIKFTVRDDTLEIRAEQVGDSVQVVFSDTGRQIFPEFEPYITQRASQWDERIAGSRTSVGMGLPFAYQVALAHNGTFTVKSDKTTGKTTFTLTLPIDLAQETKNG